MPDGPASLSKALLIHFRRIPYVLGGAMTWGPDGSLEGKFGEEHPEFVHYTNAFYLAGTLAYLENEGGVHSWTKPGRFHAEFDTFVIAYPSSSKRSYAARGITVAALNALTDIRNAVVHNAADLAKNRNGLGSSRVTSVSIPGVQLTDSRVVLKFEFLEFVRVAAMAVCFYRDGSHEIA
jgi:hypothetical protein